MSGGDNPIAAKQGQLDALRPLSPRSLDALAEWSGTTSS
jgi:hypothetical protein